MSQIPQNFFLILKIIFCGSYGQLKNHNFEALPLWVGHMNDIMGDTKYTNNSFEEANTLP